MLFTYIGILKILIYWQLGLWLQIQTGSQAHLCLVPSSVTDLMHIMRQGTYSLISIQKAKNSTCSCLLGAAKQNSLIPVRKHYYWHATEMRHKYIPKCQTQSTPKKPNPHLGLNKLFFFWVETEITWKVLWQTSAFLLGHYCCLRPYSSDFFLEQRWKILLSC